MYGTVYLPTWMVDLFMVIHVGKYSQSHGWYGYSSYFARLVLMQQPFPTEQAFTQESTSCLTELCRTFSTFVEFKGPNNLYK